MCIRDRIPASYEKLEAWTANFEEEFVKWSPYHIECNLYDGNYHAGSKVRFREIVMGLDYDAVSYTHLDVYKRQGYWKPRPFASPSIISSMKALFTMSISFWHSP